MSRTPARDSPYWLADLKPHSLNARIYGDEPDDALVESVRVQGIITPLSITPDGLVVSGNRRRRAAEKTGLLMVPVVVRHFAGELELGEAVIAANEQRERTVEQRVREYHHLKAIEARRAEQRQLAAGARGNEGGRGKRKAETLVKVSAEGFSGRSRELAAAHAGLSHATLEQGVRVVAQIDELARGRACCIR